MKYVVGSCKVNSRGEWIREGHLGAAIAVKPYDARLMRCYPVSTRINHVANDDEECSAPVEIAEAQNRLFL